MNTTEQHEITALHNIEAERAVLGSILLGTTGRDGDRVWDVCQTSGIQPDSFFDPRNRDIYAAMEELGRASKPLDYVALLEALRTSDKLEAIGGAAYIQSLIDQTPTTAHAEYYIGIVRGKEERRQMVRIAEETIRQNRDENNYPDTTTICAQAQQSLMELEAKRSKPIASWSETVKEAVARCKDVLRYGRRAGEGLNTGIHGLDKKLQGLKNATTIIIAARPSTGKTSLAMNIAECVAMGKDIYGNQNADRKKNPVLVFSLEMQQSELAMRMASGIAKINKATAEKRLYLNDQIKAGLTRYDDVERDMADAPIFVDDTTSSEISDIRARARRMKKQHDIGLIVIDYLQLCTSKAASRMNSRTCEVGDISRQCKQMARELKVPVIVLSQLSRANESNNRRPHLSDLRDSGAIEQDADVVILLHRTFKKEATEKDNADAKDERLVIADIAKNRNGETGDVRLTFDREYTRFSDHQ